MSDNVIRGTFGKNGRSASDPQEVRVGSVSIVIRGQALFTEKPNKKDVEFFEHIKRAHATWVRDGRPKSGM